MSLSDTLPGYRPPHPAGQRRLRRNRPNRVAAGVASGLGDYFAVDPVLFRVLFATSAFFGGAGILAYLLAWAAIPEQGTERAPIDGVMSALRRRRVPIWLVLIAAAGLLWAVAFSWWAPGPFFPVLGVAVLLIVFLVRREMKPTAADETTPPDGPDSDPDSDPDSGPDSGPASGSDPVAAPPAGVVPKPGAGSVSLDKDPAATAPLAPPGWVRDARDWYAESREAGRRRRRRSRPIRIAVFSTVIAVITALAIADAATGIAFQWYFWSVLAILAAGIVVAIASGRWSWSLLPLAVPAVIGAIAFGGSHASLHDGIGQREWKPTTVPEAEYRLGIGQGILDLRQLPQQDAARTVRVTMGAGQVKIISPRSLNLTVVANIHMGQLDVDDRSGDRGHGGVGVSRTVDPPATASGPPLRVIVHLADGNVTVDHR
jgi:phage shock protein PspC (stress-responsive transcriptional regulator)